MKKILIHAAEAGVASYIESIEDILIKGGYDLYYDVYGKAKNVLPSRPKWDQKKVDLIICGYDRPEIDKTKKFIDQASLIDCPKIGLLDAWRGIDRFWYKDGTFRKLTDYLLVPDLQTKNYLINRGVPNDWLIIVGHPIFDKANLHSNIDNSESKDSIKTKLNLKKEKKILLFLSEPLRFPNNAFQSLFSLQTKKNILVREWIEKEYEKEYELLCRLHPIEENYIPDNWLDVRDCNLDELMHSSDLILGLASTPVAYAIALGKKVISLEKILLNWQPEQSDFTKIFWEDVKRNGAFSNFQYYKKKSASEDNLARKLIDFINNHI